MRDGIPDFLYSFMSVALKAAHPNFDAFTSGFSMRLIVEEGRGEHHCETG
jgi:hypothetical protein